MKNTERMDKPKLLVSFSGGKTSAYMASLIKQRCSDMELLYVFANTGQEREETLKFVDDCDKHFGLSVVWVEALVDSEPGKGTRHKVVNFSTASRDGEPFEAVIKKYGIPNKAYPHCTRELKMAPIHSYLKSIGWDDYRTAIGIRADEAWRCGEDPAFVYPLADGFVDKIDVNNFWEKMPFTLNLLEHEGNCSWCWKKSDRKLMMLIKENPSIFDFPRMMEAEHGLRGYNEDGTKRKFFRRHRSTDNLFAEYDLIASSGEVQLRMFEDENSGCSESCEPFNA